MDILSNLSISGPLAWAVLAVLPVALLVSALRTLRQSRKVHPQNQGGFQNDAAQNNSPDLNPSTHHAPLGITTLIDNAPTSAQTTNATLDDRPNTEAKLVHFPLLSDNVARASKFDGGTVPQARKQLKSLERAIKRNGSRVDELILLYLQTGEYLIANSQRPDGLECIRKCIELAVANKNNRLHAQARMALGELAVDEGDSTGACEQWQLARELFTRDNAGELSTQISTHMNRCGCPTDWVLTDF